MTLSHISYHKCLLPLLLSFGWGTAVEVGSGNTKTNPPSSGEEAIDSESELANSNGLVGRPCNGVPKAWFINSWTWKWKVNIYLDKKL